MTIEIPTKETKGLDVRSRVISAITERYLFSTLAHE
jgi:hypothetical protein